MAGGFTDRKKVELHLTPEQEAILLRWDKLQAENKMQLVDVHGVDEVIGGMTLLVVVGMEDEIEREAKIIATGDLNWLTITVRSNWWEQELDNAD